MTKRVTGEHFLSVHVFCVKERERERVRGFDKHMGVVLASVCLCVSSSARAVSCILHAHREWRMTGESTQQEEGYADCNFRHGIFFSLVKKKVGGGGDK